MTDSAFWEQRIAALLKEQPTSIAGSLALYRSIREVRGILASLVPFAVAS